MHASAAMIDASRYAAISFDCYGTLIDWDSGAAAYFQDWMVRTGTGEASSDVLQIFAEAQHAHQSVRPFKPYRRVLADAFEDTARAIGKRSDKLEADRFAASVGSWLPFADTVESLQRLKDLGIHLAVLSNVDNASFAETRKHLGTTIDTVVTAEMTGAYKPDLAMFEALFSALEAKGIGRDSLLHVAQSRFHDVAPGTAIGLDVVWIDRRHGRAGSGITIASDAEPIARFESLSEFVSAFRSSAH